MQQLAPAITALLAPLGSTAPQSTAPQGPDPTLVVLGGAAHDPWLGVPEQFRAAVLGWPA